MRTCTIRGFKFSVFYGQILCDIAAGESVELPVPREEEPCPECCARRHVGDVECQLPFGLGSAVIYYEGSCRCTNRQAVYADTSESDAIRMFNVLASAFIGLLFRHEILAILNGADPERQSLLEQQGFVFVLE